MPNCPTTEYNKNLIYSSFLKLFLLSEFFVFVSIRHGVKRKCISFNYFLFVSTPCRYHLMVSIMTISPPPTLLAFMVAQPMAD